MPVLGCGAEMSRLMEVADQDVAAIEDVIQERLGLGVSQALAQRQAVDEVLAQLGEERSMVMQAIQEQLGFTLQANQLDASGRSSLSGFERFGSAEGDIQLALRQVTGLLGFDPVFDAQLSEDLPPTTPAALDRASGTVLVNSNIPISQSAMVELMTEEVLHGIDSLSASRVLSGSSPRLREGGDIFSEALEAQGEVGQFLAYPLRFNFDQNRTAAELFARLGAVYYSNPDLMRREMPQTYEAYHELFGLEQRAVGADDYALRARAWREARPSPAMRGQHGAGEQVLQRLARRADGKPDDARLGRLRAAVVRVFDAQPTGAFYGGGLSTKPADVPQFSNKSQTDTPEFKRWFGESKVVDAEGKPLVVYHATNGDFNVFETGRETKNTTALGDITTARYGVFASPDVKFAEGYLRKRVGGDNVMPLYMNVSKPIDLREGINGEDLNALINNSDGALRANDFYYMEPEEMWQLFDDEFGQNVVDSAKKAGFDGARMFERDPDTGELSEVWVVFSPTQIKSATGNNGQFNPENPDIRYANKAQTGSKWEAPENSRTDAVLQGLVDGRLDLKRVQEAIEKKSGGPLDESFDARLHETLYAGRVAERADQFLKTEAKPLLEAMARNKVTMDELSDYLQARHAPERNAQIAKVNPAMPDGGAGTNSKGVLMTTQAANDYIAAITPARRTLLDLLAAKVDGITKGTRDLLVAEGLETQETIDNWLGAYKHYVPLNRDEAAEGGFSMSTGQGMSVKGSASKRAMGSERKVTNMLAHLLLQREAAITRAEKNRVGMSLYGLALTEPNPDFWTTVHPKKESMALAAELQNMGVDQEAILDMGAAPTVRSIDPRTGKVVTRTNPMYKNLPNALVVKVDGEDRVIVFNKNNERAMRMVKNLKNLDGQLNHEGLEVALRYANIPTRFVAKMATQYNPAFGAYNVTRDTLGALVNLSTTEIAGKQLQVLSHLREAAVGIARDLRDDKQRTAWSDLYRQFREDGGQTGYMDSTRDPNERAKKIEAELKALQSDGKLTATKAAGAVLDLIDGFNTTLENTVRLSAYKVALDSGLSREKAARLARELTIDFNRKGSATNFIGPFYAFFNAAVQGISRTARTLNGPKGRAIILGGLALGVTQAMMLAAAGFDDDEITEFAKARAFIVPIGYKRYVSIPLPLGLHILPNTGRVVTELAMSKGKDLGEKTLSAIGEIAASFSPVGTNLYPTLMDPFVELASNKNFAGVPISKETNSNDPKPGYLQGRESTLRLPAGEVYQGIAKSLNWLTSGGREFSKGFVSPTPEEVRYVTMAVGGGLLREIEKTTNASILKARGEEVPMTMIPLGGRFAGQVDDDRVQRARYFKNNSKVQALAAELKSLRTDGQNKKAAQLEADDPRVELAPLGGAIRSALGKLNKEARENMGDPQRLKDLDRERVELMRELNDQIKALENTPPEKLQARREEIARQSLQFEEVD